MPGFDWDEGNERHIWDRHQYTKEEVEEVFADPDLIPAQAYERNGEQRHGVIGSTFDARMVFIAYTVRADKIRPISMRPARREERRAYEEKRDRP